MFGKFRIFVVVFAFLSFNVSTSQNYSLVDKIVDSYPNQVTSSSDLAVLINKDFKLPAEKARAIFRWVSTNIGFDTQTAESMNYESSVAFSYKTEEDRKIKEKKFKTGTIKSVISSRKAVCHGYSMLVEDLCDKVGLKSAIIVGNLKSDPSQIGVQSTPLNHAWNAIMIGTQWKLIDATLGAGYISSSTGSFEFDYNEGYFFTDPARFFLNHFPLNEKWLFVSNNKNSYIQQPLFFSPYIKYSYTISKATFGIHSISLSGDFTFSIDGLLEQDDIQYGFSSENKRKFIQESDNQGGFKIGLDNKQDNYLYIFVNGELLVAYKIIK